MASDKVDQTEVGDDVSWSYAEALNAYDIWFEPKYYAKSVVKSDETNIINDKLPSQPIMNLIPDQIWATFDKETLFFIFYNYQGTYHQ